jgi:hypothetical protein
LLIAGRGGKKGKKVEIFYENKKVQQFFLKQLKNGCGEMKLCVDNFWKN